MGIESIERVTAPPWGPKTQVYREHMARYNFAKNYIAHRKVLDVACGSGFGSFAMAEVAEEVVGLDLDEQAIRFAKEHYQEENLHYETGSATALPFGDAEFGAVVSFETIEHLLDQEKFLEEVRRVLEPSGIFLVSTPDRETIPYFFVNPTEYNNPFHVKELSKRELSNLLAKRFHILEWFGQGLFTGQKNGNRQALSGMKKYFTWLPESWRLKLKSFLLGAGNTSEIFELHDKRSKYLIAVCRT